MKIKAIDFMFGKWFFSSTKKEKLKYLLVDTSKARTTYFNLVNCEAMPTQEFDSVEDVSEYIENCVAKNDTKYTRVFKEIELFTEQNNHDQSN